VHDFSLKTAACIFLWSLLNIKTPEVTEASLNTRNRSKLTIDEETAKQIKERDFLWLNESEIAQITGISDSNYMLDTDYGTIVSIRKLTGLYYVAPSESSADESGAE
jgi:hypothetical protein